jgi:integrase
MTSYRKDRKRQPKLTHHKASGQGVVRINGKDVYCGPYGTTECNVRYLQALTEWEAAGRHAARVPASKPPAETDDLTINELMVAYLQFADAYYVKNGRPTSEPGNIRLAIRLLRQLYGDMQAGRFGPLQLKAVRQAMVDGGLCRNEVNRRVRLIVRGFKWAVAEGMVPHSVHHGLKSVDGLKKGRCGVRESKPVKPVPDAFVEAVLPHVSRQVATMIQLQCLTGMRPGEVTVMRTMDINASGAIWEYQPGSHKTEHHDKDRIVFLGPKAQAVLKPWLRTDLAAYLFSPREAVAEHRSRRRQQRKTRVQPSQQDRRKRDPGRVIGDRYNTASYGHAIAKGCQKAGVPHWAPNQLRHGTGTRLRREFGLDVARAVLGHSSPVVTEVYAELDGAKAAEAMERVG